MMSNIEKGLPNLVEMEEGRYDAAAFDAFSPSRDYSPGNARAMGWLSQLAYEDDEAKIDRVLSHWGLARIGKGGVREPRRLVPDTRYLIAVGRGAAFIAFAGTDPLSLGEWLLDFMIFTGFGDVHPGFAGAADSAKKGISKHESQILEQPAIFLAGHSLGGALAILTARRLQEHDPPRPVDGVYVFGCPRVGRAKFASSYDEVLGTRTFRLVHGEDLVARLPPTVVPIVGYRHVGLVLETSRYEKFDGRLPGDLGTNKPRLDATAPAIDALGRLMARDISVDAKAHQLCLSYDWLPSVIGDHVPDRYLYALGA